MPIYMLFVVAKTSDTRTLFNIEEFKKMGRER